MNEQAFDIWREIIEQGTKCLAQERYPEAEKYFAQGVALAQELGIAVALAFSLRLWATAKVKLGQLDQAKEGFEKALDICQAIDNRKGISEAKAGLASVFLAKGSLEEAARCYEEAIEVYPPSSPRLRLAMIYTDLGQVYSNMEDWGKAQNAYQHAINLCQFSGYQRGVGELSVLMGEIFYKQGKIEEAKKWISESCIIFLGLDSESSLANAFQYLAFIHFETDELEAAIQHQLRAIALWLRQKDEQEASESCYFLSKILQRYGEINEAQNYTEISIKLYQKMDLGLAVRYQSLAGIAFLKADYPLAERLYLKALQLFEANHDDLKCAEVCESLATVVELQGRAQEALKWQTLSVNKLSPHGLQAVTAIMRLGDYHNKRRKYYEALKCYWQAWEIAESFGLDTREIEKRVQKVSMNIRMKK